MEDAPELTSITRPRTVRPLIAAWIFVIVLLATGFFWLSLSSTPLPEAADLPEQALEQSLTSSEETTQALLSPINEEVKEESKEEKNIVSSVTGIPPDVGSESKPGPPDFFSGLDQISPVGAGLPKAPSAELHVDGPHGPLPVLGPDSRVAWQEYARPVGRDIPEDQPRIALIVTGMGLNARITDMAIKKLPPAVDLGFSPYASAVQDRVDAARRYGHETFLMLPMEPVSYPDDDPGPHVLLTGASARDNLKKLDWLLGQMTGYVGVINEMGSKFTTSEADLLPVLQDLQGRGLMLLDSRASRFSIASRIARKLGMPRAFNNLYIDNSVTRTAIQDNLKNLENTARTYGVALGVARAYPLSIEEISDWAQKLESRGFHLVPVTAVANRQPIR